jgi:two-component sensor histidine kinase
MIGWATDRWRSVWHFGLRRRSPSAILFAIACVAVATAVRMGLGLISPDSAVFAPYYSTTLVSALVAGPEAGGLATVLGGVAAWQLFVLPDWDIASFRLEQLVSFALYGTSSVVIIWAAESYRSLLEQLRQEQVRRQLLNRELVHRMKNMLAGVQAILRQSLRNHGALFDTVTARVAVLGVTNELLLDSEQQSASLREILSRELSPYGLSRSRLEGDDIECPQTVAVTLALIFHELTTNAVKYGALSTLHGRVDVTWSIKAGRLDLEWVESGGPLATAPRREGFGSKLLRAGVRHHHGSLDCSFEPSGLRCRFSLTMLAERRKESTAPAKPLAAPAPTLISPAGTKAP